MLILIKINNIIKVRVESRHHSAAPRHAAGAGGGARLGPGRPHPRQQGHPGLPHLQVRACRVREVIPNLCNQEDLPRLLRLRLPEFL